MLALFISVPVAHAAPVCTLVVDATTGAVLVRDGDGCDRRTSPMSTFKIAISAMGYDAGILRDEHAPAWPFKEGYPAWRESWKQTTDPTRWLAESVVWYSQAVTRALGVERFRRYVDAFDYGNRDVTGDPARHDGLTTAWLNTSLQISPVEEVAFVRRLIGGGLPISDRAKTMTMAIMPESAASGDWVVKGKTGSGDLHDASGRADDGRQFGWFVGWARRGERTVVFARLVNDDRRDDRPAGLRVRDSLVADLPKLLRGLR